MYIRNSGLINRADKGRLLSYIPSMWGSRHSEVISTFLRISVFFLVKLIFPFLLYLSYCRKFSRRHKIQRRDENRHYGAAKSTAIFCKFPSSLVYRRKKRKRKEKNDELFRYLKKQQNVLWSQPITESIEVLATVESSVSRVHTYSCMAYDSHLIDTRTSTGIYTHNWL